MKKILLSIFTIFMVLMFPLSVIAEGKETREVEENKKVNVSIKWEQYATHLIWY